MTIVEIPNSGRKYSALSTDFPGLSAPNLSWVGAEIFFTDTELSYEVNESLVLIPKLEGSSGGGGGSSVVTNAGTFVVQDNGTAITEINSKLPTVLGINGGLKIEGIAGGIAVPTSGILAAGEAYIGKIGGNTAEIDVTPTLTVSGTYASGDYVGTSSTPMSFVGASRINNFTGTILSAVLIDGALQSAACELWLFDTTLVPPTDNAAWTLTDAETKRCIGIIPFSTYYASASNSVSFAPGIGIGFKTINSSTTLYGCLVTRGSPSYASGDLTVRLTILQD